MRPDIVTFWHGPLDALRLTCLRSQVAAGHKVTVYSFEPLAGLPDGVGNAEAEAILPHAFSERLRPPQPDGSWRDWTMLQFSDFFRMRLMARERRAVARCRRAAAETGRDRSGKTLFRLGAAAPARQFRALSAGRTIRSCVAFEDLMEQEELTPDWLALRHRLTFALRRLRGGSQPSLRYSRRDLRSGGADRARPPRRRTASCPAEEIVLRGSCRTKTLLRAFGFFSADRRSRHYRVAHLARKAAATSHPFPAASMPGRRSGLGVSDFLRPCIALRRG